jgi:thioredoxin reductase (NADPH)
MPPGLAEFYSPSMIDDDRTLTVYSAPWCPHCKRVKRFLAAHRVRYENVDIDQRPEAIDALKEIQDGGQIIPTVVYGDGSHEVNPSDEALARRIGLTVEATRAAYDLVIVGGGPAGLAAAIYAAREGIDAIVVDGSALGGQAGVSDRIDNYPGFPRPAATASSSSRPCRWARSLPTGPSWSRPWLRARSWPATPSSWPPGPPTGASTSPARRT